MAVLVGVDQGTTGTRTVVYDGRLRRLGEAYREIEQHHPRPGWVEHDPEELVASVVETLAGALADADVGRVDALGLANQGETTVAWDGPTGKPLAPAIVWQDRRTETILDRMRAEGRAEEVERRSRLPLDPYFSSSKMRWLVEEVPAVRRAAGEGRLRIGTSDAFLRARLGGRSATDAATASRTQLLALESVTWDEGLGDAFGVDVDALPAIEPVAADLGILRHPQLGELPLRAAIVDQQAALAGQRCFSEGDAKCTYGTGCFLLTNAGTDVPPGRQGLLPTVAWTLDGRTTYALDGGVLTAGSCLRWLVRVGLLSSPEEADALAGTVEDAAGVRFLPALAGVGAPWWRSAARGVWAGLTSATTPAHLVRAVLEGIAFRVRDILERAAALGVGPPSSLRVDGGLTGSRVLMRFQADLLGIPLERPADPELTALGVAALAALGAGVFAGTDEIDALLPAAARIEPAGSEGWRSEAYERWLSFLERASELA